MPNFSRVQIGSQLREDANSGTNTRRSTQAIRAAARTNPVFVNIAENFDAVQNAVDRIVKALRRPADVGRIEIASADILDLIVGGRTGPGMLEVLSGPPSYARVGFIGTLDSGVTVAVTSVSGTSVTTAAPHDLLVGDIVHIRGNTSVNHIGWHEVAGTPTETTLTLVGPVTGSGTGGTLERTYAGGHFRSIFLGGNDPEESPLYSTPTGQLRIGKNGSVSLRDSFDVEKGYIGVTAPEANKSVSGTADNGSGLVRLTVTGHAYESGDTVIAGTAGYAITVIDANTIDLIGSVFGTFTPVGTVARYFAGIWDEQHASGGTGYQDAPFRAKADGSVRIGDVTKPHFEVSADGDLLIGETAGPRVEIDGATGDMAITDAVITLTKNGIVTTIGNDPDASATGFAGVTIYDETDDDGLELTKNALYWVKAGGVGSRWETDNGGPSDLIVIAGTGGSGQYANSFLSLINRAVLIGDPPELIFDGDTVIDLNRNGFFNAVDFDDPATTRNNLDVYSKAEVDALLGGATFVTQAAFDAHTHSFSDSGTTTLDAGHTHGFAVSGNTAAP